MEKPTTWNDPVRTHHVEASRRAAEELASASRNPEHIEAAQRLIRQVMYEHALSRVTIGERDAILALLDFARPLPEETSQ
jgi:hypothetical protein